MGDAGIPKLSWSTEHYVRHQRSVDWYWILGILASIIVVVTVIQKNYLLAVIVTLGSILMIILARRDNHTVSVACTDKGIIVNNHFYPYKKIVSFWIYASPQGDNRVLFEMHRAILPYLSLPIGNEVSDKELRGFLRAYIKEKEHPEPALDSIMRNIKF